MNDIIDNIKNNCAVYVNIIYYIMNNVEHTIDKPRNNLPIILPNNFNLFIIYLPFHDLFY